MAIEDNGDRAIGSRLDLDPEMKRRLNVMAIRLNLGSSKRPNANILIRMIIAAALPALESGDLRPITQPAEKKEEAAEEPEPEEIIGLRWVSTSQNL